MAVRRPLFTGRAALLGVLILILALTLAGPIRQFLAGRAELVQLAADGTQLDRRVAELADQLDRQADPDYAAREARQRLTYVLPGDRLIMVVDGETAESAPGDVTGEPAEPLPWYEGLLESLSRAAAGPAE